MTQVKLHEIDEANIDGGWAYSVLFASVVGLAIIFGISFSSAIFYVIFLEAFQEAPATTAWAVGLNTCACYLFLPIASFTNKRLKDVWTMVIGTVLSSLGLIFSAFAQNLTILCITFGCLTGVGWAFVYMCIVHSMFLFFKRYRKLAVAIAMLGIAFGQFIYPPFLETLLLYYDWRGTILILGALNLNLLILAAMFVAGKAKQLSKVEEELLQKRDKSSRDLLDELKEILEVCKDPYFLLFNISTILAALAVGAFQTHITRTSLLAGHDTFKSAMLPSAIGASGLGGRIVWGLLAQNVRRLSVIWMNIFCYGGLSIVGVICFFSRTYPALLSCSLLFGFFIGFWALHSEVIVAVTGLERAVHAIGVNGLFTGGGLLIGPPLVAWLSQTDPSYRLSFGFSALSLFVSSVILIPSARMTPTDKGWGGHRRNSEVVDMGT